MFNAIYVIFSCVEPHVDYCYTQLLVLNVQSNLFLTNMGGKNLRESFAHLELYATFG
jgi:hypothetical protein